MLDFSVGDLFFALFIFIYSYLFSTTKNPKLISNLYLTSVDESIQTDRPNLHFNRALLHSLIRLLAPISPFGLFLPLCLVNALCCCCCCWIGHIALCIRQYLIHKQLLKCQSINFNVCDVHCIPCTARLLPLRFAAPYSTEQTRHTLRLMMIVLIFMTDSNNRCIWLKNAFAAAAAAAAALYMTHKWNCIFDGREKKEKTNMLTVMHLKLSVYISIINLWNAMNWNEMKRNVA